MTRRQCLECADEGIGPKALAEFGIDQRGPGGKRTQCRVHANEAALRSYRKNAAVQNARRRAKRLMTPLAMRPWDKSDPAKARVRSARYRLRVKLGLVTPKRRSGTVEFENALQIAS